jgi:uncharacterized cupin superfamily protein
LAGAGAFTIVHKDALERDGRWMLARRTLGLNAFGLNMVEIEPGDSLTEHNEADRDQEEVFFVIEGDCAVSVDGTEHPAPAGTLVRLDPEPRRNVHNRGETRATVVIMSAPRTSGYEPMGWA